MKNITAAEIRRNAANLAPLESQKEYRHRISEFIRMHTARVAALDSGISPSAVPGNSMLILARTGSGKSYTAARLAEAAGVEFITIDCSSLTRSGYKGCNLGDLLSSAKKSCKEGSRFERAILFFDEADKLQMDGMPGNPQVNFLKLFDGIIQVDPSSSRSMTIDVSRMSFLFAGAFSGLEDIVRTRLTPRSIGFNTAPNTADEVDDLLSLATMADIRDYGFMEELLGRMGSLCYIPPLTVADYRTLIKGSSGSVCSRYNNLLAPSGVTLDISDSACAHIAKEAGKSALGARAVDPIIYEQLRPAICKLDEDETISHITLSCRSDRLILRYSHGRRVVEKIVENEVKKTHIVPDVCIAHYLTSEEDIRELCSLSMEIFDRPGTEEEKLLCAFLRCTLLFMNNLNHERDKVLSSLTKLADSTEKISPKDSSTYDRIINSDLTKRRIRKDELYEQLNDAYSEFQELENENTHDFLVHATKLLRQNWYRSLLDAASCA